MLKTALFLALFAGIGIMPAEAQISYRSRPVTMIVPFVAGGPLDVVAVASDKRIQAIPDIPTTDEAGLPVLDMVNWNALFAPKGTSPAIVQRLEEEIRAALGDPTVAARLSDLGTQPIDQSRLGSEQLQSRLASEISRWAPVIERSGQFTE